MEKSEKRGGETSVTSVSVSNNFREMISQHNLSPTECFRRGVAVTLYDLGVAMYQSDRNKERSKYMHEFLKKIQEDEKHKEMEKDVAELQEILNQMKILQSKFQNLSLKWEVL